MDLIPPFALGLLVGGAAVWLLAAEVMRRRSEGVYHFGRKRSSIAHLVRSRHQASTPPEQTERLLRALDLNLEIEGSPLREVIGIGASSVVGDVTVELIAIEIRDGGCRGSLRFVAVDEQIDPAQPFVAFGQPEVTVADDLGTTYETGAAGWSGSLTPGSGIRGDAEFRFGPRPPSGAHRLIVVIERFRESHLRPDKRRLASPEGTPGPWVFTVELSPGSAAPPARGA